jgi:hypothetical protein
MTVPLVARALNTVQISTASYNAGPSCVIESALSPGSTVIGLSSFVPNTTLKGVPNGAANRLAPTMFLVQAGAGAPRLTVACTDSVSVAWSSALSK